MATTAPTLYDSATWVLTERQKSATIVFFDILGSWAQAQYLAIHRITNDWDKEVIVQTEHNFVHLGPANSLDVSSTEVTISVPATVVHIPPGDQPHGTYKLLCCSMAMAQAPAPKPAGASSDPAMKTPGGGGGGGGNGGGGGGGNGNPPGKDPVPVPPDPMKPLNDLVAEKKKIEDKLVLAKAHGVPDSVINEINGLLKILDGEIGQAVIAEARAELEQLGKDIHKLIL
jgi:hypothetical protein